MAQNLPTFGTAETLQTASADKTPGQSKSGRKKQPRGADFTFVESGSKCTRRAIKEANIPPIEILESPLRSRERAILKKSRDLPLSPRRSHDNEQ